MNRRPPSSTRTDTLFPYTTLFRSVRAGVEAVAVAARSGVLRVDEELHLSVLPAEDEDPEVIKLRAKLDLRIGEVKLPEVILAVDAQVRFSWIMLGREPRSTEELLRSEERGVGKGCVSTCKYR